jgi:hypothetical protein
MSSGASQPLLLNNSLRRAGGVWTAGLLLAGVLAGCQEAPRTQPANNQVFVSGAKVSMNGDASGLFGDKPAAPAAPVLLPQEGDPSFDWSDPCAGNLQTLTGQLLFYYSAYGHLPPSLDQVPAMPGEDKAALVCPKTGKPYVYFPQGLRAPPELMAFDRKTGNAREGNMLILVDSVPAHAFSQRLLENGKERVEKQTVRLGIVMEPPGAGKSVKMYVVPVQQALLDAYRRNAG